MLRKQHSCSAVPNTLLLLALFDLHIHEQNWLLSKISGLSIVFNANLKKKKKKKPVFNLQVPHHIQTYMLNIYWAYNQALTVICTRIITWADMKTAVSMRVKRKLNMLIYIYSLGKLDHRNLSLVCDC
jgi:hypothetical protein